MIKVMIVDDSAVVRSMLREQLGSEPDIEVVGVAHDPLFALQKLDTLCPDVLVVDVEMPRMDDLTFLRQLMQQKPIPTIVFSSLAEQGSAIALDAMDAGAVAILCKPGMGVGQFIQEQRAQLVQTVRQAAGARLRGVDRRAADEPGEALHGLPLQGRHVLLVEDDALNLEVASEQLLALGLRLSTARNGREALQRLAADASIELVLMDLQMPEMDGLETLRRLRPLYPELTVIALTASNLSGDRERCLAAGMSDYLAKPVDPRHLEALLERWLARAPQSDGGAVAPTPRAVPEAGLPEIAGLDQRAALERLLGNHTLYRNLLLRFVEDHAGVPDELLASLEAQSGEDAQALLHRFKSMAATLGAVQLESLSVTLEQELRDAQPWRASYAAFAGEFRRLREAVLAALAMSPGEAGAPGA
ncbi:response regulator [Zestomonas thermotolerans]|uniref:response regulator n=1 Tax=Zestomonas thermotolerans TaxID=157784 RepID=UPI0003752A98|nr:response regulator [Pseudomonas thermotolerans]